MKSLPYSRFASAENMPHRTGLRAEGDCQLYPRIAGMALRRPRMIPYLLRAAWAFRARDWYRRVPFLPIPPRSYMRWRLETAYGDPNATPTIDEMERYLRWTARMREQMTRRAHD